VSTPTPDHFSLFGLEPRFGLDGDELARAYRTVQAHVHPDRYAAAGAAERRAALQWATLANEAFQVLNSPVRRAAYLCERHGVEVGREGGASVPADFLEQQMQWRHALEQIRAERNMRGRDQLLAQARALREQEMEQLQAQIDVDRDFTGAAACVRRLMFIEKFLHELTQFGEEPSGVRAD